ncbi:DEAD/DEAH box helicase [Tautonia rosea]|uniref:DEAD/DEAH box helicase n=1 Tax=Tautonia rosea TaxID=2728037 RepID=UPI0014729AF2|nr:helicase-related protein [Tautonia rosea]
MNDLLHQGTACLARILSEKLPDLSPDWWEKYVIDRLSFQQQRTARERGFTSLQQLDFAALLRILDQNWFELSGRMSLPREARSWVKELQGVRNKWAHLSAEAVPASETWRDADTLGRLLAALGAGEDALAAVESAKATALSQMAGSVARPSGPAPSQAEEREAPRPQGETTLFKVGDLVALRSNPSVILPVIEVIPGGAECRYRVFENNAKATYYESQLQAPVAEEDERASLSPRALHAHLTSLQLLSPSTANLFSLRSGRVQFVPYQYRPVLKLIRADRPRLLIADEVGVGKTIEAGLILKELRARMDISSVLVICPKPLVAEQKWFSEMKRFDEHFTALDGKLLRHCLRETDLEGEWPEQYSKVILPFSLFDSDLVFGNGSSRNRKKGQGLLGLDPPPKFDLVIVDEAHHIRNTSTFLHNGVRFFCDHAQAVLLMTATPVQLGSEDLFTLLNVLRPDLIMDRPSFEQMAGPNRHINEAAQAVRRAADGWQQEAAASLDEVARTEWGRMFLRESPAFQGIYDRLHGEPLSDVERVGAIRSIEELYTFSSLINRTRRRDIGEFTTRRPETLTVPFTPSQQQLHDGLLDVIERILTRCHGQQNVRFMMTTIRRQAASCLYGLAPLLADILNGKLDQLELMEASDSEGEDDIGIVPDIRADIASLIEQAKNLDPDDPKRDAFVKVLLEKNRLANNKALVFSTFRHTLAYLDARLATTGLRVGLIHGNVHDEDRRRIRKRFALPKEDPEAIDVLLSSEVGCEGLDFQFCDFLVNYDLPWNPMRIEQRIGRIDRYGQKSEAVAIVNLITPGTVDADIYNRCLLRIGVFHHAVGASEEILGEITQEIHDIAESFSLSAGERANRLQQLADNRIRQISEEQELEARQADLFGLNVPGQAWREEVEAAQTFWLTPQAILRCVSAYLATRLASDSEHFLGEKAAKTLRLGQEARNLLLEDYRRLPRSVEPTARAWEKWLKGDQQTLSVTFDQEAASDAPEAVYLSILHPLVRQAARYLELTEPACFAGEVDSSEVAPGTYRFALYRWARQGIRPDETLIGVAEDMAVEERLLVLLQSARASDAATLPDGAACDALDARHHARWSEARASHIAENRELADHRIQSLTVSHRARCKSIEDQLAQASNENIRRMKQGELARAHADFDRRIAELQQAANSGDIHGTPVVFGTLKVME